MNVENKEFKELKNLIIPQIENVILLEKSIDTELQKYFR